MGKITVLGAPFLDLIYGFPLSEMNGEKRGKLDLKLAPGGPASNLATGLARLEANSSLQGMVGADWFGRYLQTVLEEEGVDTGELIVREEKKTGIVFPVIDSKGVQRGFELLNDPVQFQLTESEIGDFSFSGVQFLFADGILLMEKESRKALVEGVKRANDCGVSVVFDPNFRLQASVLKSRARNALDKILEGTDYLVLNREELEVVREVSFPDSKEEDLAEELAAADMKAVIVKQGLNGHEVVIDGKTSSEGPFSVEAVDGQGTGDAFDAGFIAGLSKGLTIEESAKVGSAAGAIVCTEQAAWSPLPKLIGLRYFLKYNGAGWLADKLEEE